MKNMKTTEAFVQYLENLDVKLFVDGVDLCYNAPKGVLTAGLRSQMADRKQKIIAYLKQTAGAQGTGESIERVSRDQDLPLSFFQEQLWFLERMKGINSTYNIIAAFHLKGQLHIDLLEKSFNEVVSRHEILRTVFPEKNGKPLQAVSAYRDTVLAVKDLAEIPGDLQPDRVQKMADEETRRPFDLTVGPLLRAILLKLGETHHVLLFSMHHIISDGWSMGIFFKEVSALYSAFCSDRPSPLKEPPVQYADFACWQRKRLTESFLAPQVTYWTNRLAGAPPLLELPSDGPRPPVQTFRGRTDKYLINRELGEKLERLSRQSGATLFMTLLTGFAVLLSRHSSREDVVIGSPIAIRGHRDIESLIGYFVNTLTLRIRLSGNPTFLELLNRVRRHVLKDYAHQDLPFNKLVDELQPQRHSSFSPLFQVLFVLQNTPPGKLELPGINVTNLELNNQTAKLDLSLSIIETEEGLRGDWEYNIDLWDESSIRRMANHFETILQWVTDNPGKKMSMLSLLSEAHRQRLLKEWNDTYVEYPEERTVHELFEEQAGRNPGALAVVYGDKQLNYGQLNSRANQLAHYLRSRGVGTETPVCIVMENSLDMVTGLLGIFKAGGVYVPLDPGYTKNRLVFMLEDSKAAVLLTSTRESLTAELPETEARIICIHRDTDEISRQSVENPAGNVKLDDAAYMIYTSGSTGKPKGVLVSHRSIVDYCHTFQRYYRITGSDRLLQFYRFTFDASLEQLLPPFTAGAAVVLRHSALWDVKEFCKTITGNEITVVFQPPGFLHEFVKALEKNPGLISANKIRAVIVGGDVMLPETVKLWRRVFPGSVRLFNVYGPTETTIAALIFDVSAGFNERKFLRNIPIGHPIANRRVYIGDAHGNPVPIGITGELYIGGSGLARGYLNHPELTAEKFCLRRPGGSFCKNRPLDPHKNFLLGAPKDADIFVNDQWPVTNDRLYGTGDLARYLPDGNIEFMGRVDRQVKIRGFRVELGEIEAVLRSQPGVNDAVVITREDVPGDKRLTAYVVIDDAVELSTAQIHGYVKKWLPDYMLPSTVVILDKMPLNPNGKIDSRALPAPSDEPKTDAMPEEPGTIVVQKLKEITEELLNVKNISANDNFFDLAANSLLIIQFVSKIEDVFGVTLAVADFMDLPTISQLAEKIELTSGDEPNLDN